MYYNHVCEIHDFEGERDMERQPELTEEEQKIILALRDEAKRAQLLALKEQ